MTIKYAVFDPSKGVYTEFDTIESAQVSLAQTAWDFYLLHTHNVPCAIVTYAEDGSSTWKTPQGQDIPGLGTIQQSLTDLAAGLTP